MMDLEDIRTYARQLRRHGVDALELQEDSCLLRLRIDRGPSAPPVQAETPDTGSLTDLLTVRSAGLGLLKLDDPETGFPAVAPGSAVAQGQLLALLELDGAATPVASPSDGVIAEVLADAGQRVDYGMPLFHIRVLREAAAFQSPTPAAGPAQTPASAEARAASDEYTVTAPLTGTFYRAARPGARPLAEPGGRLAAHAPVCVIEAMKMMTEVNAECAGSVLRVLCEDGQAVVQGQPLLVIQPDEPRHVP